jgi:plasmid stabilization system protein ParE
MSVPMVRDSFETGTVDPATWKDKQIEPHQVAFSNGAAEGEKAVVITTTSRDGGVSCGDNPCQRAELRLHGNLRPLYGEEVFFGFSFRMSGDIQPFGSNRTIIGQWKAPGDDSPILAQRFDNGVFHITIQDGPKRIVVASAEGDPDALDEFQSVIESVCADPNLGPAVLRTAKARADLRAYDRCTGGTPGPAAADEAVAVLKSAAASLGGAPHDRLEALFDEFSFIQELEAYAGKTSCRVHHCGPKKLPDPKKDWVDMIYRIKGGRTDNVHGPNHEGELDIWANGTLIAEVRGNMGYRLTKPSDRDTMYFKFGMYRNPLPNTILFHFDNYRQGPNFSDVS